MSSGRSSAPSASQASKAATSAWVVALVASVFGPLYGHLTHTDPELTAFIAKVLMLVCVLHGVALWLEYRYATGPSIRAAKEPGFTAPEIYVRYIAHRHLVAGAALILGVVAIAVVVVVFKPADAASLLWLATVPTSLFALTGLRLRLLQLQVHRNSYGASQIEARELIEFILVHPEKFDSGDGAGPLASAIAEAAREDEASVRWRGGRLRNA